MAGDSVNIKVGLTDDLSKPLESVTKGLDDAKKAGEGLTKQVKGPLTQGFDDLKKGAKAFQVEIAAATAAFVAAGALMVGAVVGIVEVTKELYESFVPLRAAQHVFELKYGKEGNKVLSEMVSWMESVGVSSEDATKRALKLARAFDNPAGAKEVSKIIEDMRHNLSLDAGQVDQLTEKFVKLAGKTQATNEDFKGFVEATGKAPFNVQQLADVLQQTSKVDPAAALRQATAFMKGDGKVSAIAFAEAVKKGEEAFAGVSKAGDAAAKAAASSLPDQLARIGSSWEELKKQFAGALFDNPQIVAIVKELADTLQELSQQPEFKAFVARLQELGKVLVNDIAKGFEFIKPYLLQAVGWITSLNDGTEAGNAHWKELKLVLFSVGSAVVGVIAVFAAMAVQAYELYQAFDYVFQSFPTWVNVAVAALKQGWTWIKETFAAGVAFVMDIPSKMFQLGTDMVTGLVDGIKSMASAPIDAIKNMGTSAINALKGVWDSHSPSLVFEAEGVNAADGVTQGIDKGSTRTEAAGRTLGSDVVGATRQGIASAGSQAPIGTSVVDQMGASSAASASTGAQSRGAATGETFNNFTFGDIVVNVEGGDAEHVERQVRGVARVHIKKEIRDAMSEILTQYQAQS